MSVSTLLISGRLSWARPARNRQSRVESASCGLEHKVNKRDLKSGILSCSKRPTGNEILVSVLDYEVEPARQPSIAS